MPPFDPYLFSSAKQIIDSTSESYIVDEITRNIISICNEEKVINEDQYPSHFDAVCDYISKVMPNANLSFDSDIIKQCVAVQMLNEVDDVIIFINHGIRMLQILMLNSLVCCKFKPDDFRYASSKLGNPADYFNETSPFILGLPFFIKSMNIPITFAGTINWKKLNIKNNEA